jgi:hypothetical protein
MTITNRDGIIAALAGNHTQFLFDKLSIANMASTQLASLWRATGVPGQGAIPGAAAVCTSALAGALPFVNQVAPAAAYVAHVWYASTQNATTLELHDRLAHMGGLSGTVTTAQGSLALTGVAAARLGPADFSELSWWLEWYTDTGATAASATVGVTYDDNSTGSVSLGSLGTTVRAARMFPIRPAVAGRRIKAVNSVTLSASTGTAGNFGITATRPRAAMSQAISNKMESYDWAALGLPKIENDACLFLILQCNGSSTGGIRGAGKMIYG